MALRRRTRTRLQIVAAVAAIGDAVGLVISWLLSEIHDHPYGFAGLENGIGTGLTVGGALAAVDLFYVQSPRGPGCGGSASALPSWRGPVCSPL